jgi:hypothetical protein
MRSIVGIESCRGHALEGIVGGIEDDEVADVGFLQFVVEEIGDFVDGVLVDIVFETVFDEAGFELVGNQFGFFGAEWGSYDGIVGDWVVD